MQDLTTGSIPGHIARYAAFIFATMLFQTLYFLVDLYFVGQLGAASVAAVSISGNLMFLVMAVTQALGVGTTTLVAQAVGAKDMQRATHTLAQSQVLSLGLGLLFGVIAFTTRHEFAAAFAADAVTAREIVAYLDWFIPALVLQFALVALAGALRGAGDVKFASLVQVTTVVINTVLAPVLITGWGTGKAFGVAGAGLATFIAVAVGVVWVWWVCSRPGAPIRLTFRRERPDGGLWRRLVGIGAPAGGEFLMMAILLGFIQALLSDVGAAAQAGFGVGLRLMQAIFLPAMAVAFALAPIAAQNVGARRVDRIREAWRVGLIGSCGVMFLATLVVQAVPAALVGTFTDDPAAIAVGVEYMHIVSWIFVGNGAIFAASGMFQAFGNTWPTLIASAARVGLYAATAVWLVGLAGFELAWLWWLSVASSLLQLVVVVTWVQLEMRKRLAALASG